MHHLKSYQLAVAFYREAKGTSLPYYLKDQLRRAALSIALNLSEGTGRTGTADRRRFFEIALGSIRECQSIVEIESEAFTAAQRDLLDHLGACTYKLAEHAPLSAGLRPRATCLLPRAPGLVFQELNSKHIRTKHAALKPMHPLPNSIDEVSIFLSIGIIQDNVSPRFNKRPDFSGAFFAKIAIN